MANQNVNATPTAVAMRSTSRDRKIFELAKLLNIPPAAAEQMLTTTEQQQAAQASEAQREFEA